MFLPYTRIFFIVAIALILYIPSTVAAGNDDDFLVAGWIPYWRDSEGIKDVKKQLDIVDVVYPFAYTVTIGGALSDQAGLDERDWRAFVRTLRRKNIEVIPTIMWSDSVSMHTVLSNESLRKMHIEHIVKMVEEGRYDGVDIDYEGRKAETKDAFSDFLKELKDELGKEKLLVCTLEARTPPDSLYKEVPKTIAYSNDYKKIDKYCDRVQLMTYDQQRADIKLNAERAGEPYMPVSDPDWVRKVIELALEDFDAEKLVVGIPSYGRHMTVTVQPNWYSNYQMIGALNMPDMLDLAKEYKVKPSRNKAGEMSFTYLPKDSKVKFKKSLKVPKNTPDGNIVAAKALAYANKTGKTVQFNMGWYSDAEAMLDKVDLAKEYNLAGVAFFKFDGEEDQKIWKMIKE